MTSKVDQEPKKTNENKMYMMIQSQETIACDTASHMSVECYTFNELLIAGNAFAHNLRSIKQPDRHRDTAGAVGISCTQIFQH